MMKFILIAILIFSFSAFSQVASKEDIKNVLTFMESQGLFKKEDLENARKDLEGMSDKDLAELNSMATTITEKNKNIADFKNKVQSGGMPMPTEKQLQELKEQMKIYQDASERSDLKK